MYSLWNRLWAAYRCAQRWHVQVSDRGELCLLKSAGLLHRSEGILTCNLQRELTAGQVWGPLGLTQVLIPCDLKPLFPVYNHFHHVLWNWDTMFCWANPEWCAAAAGRRSGGAPGVMNESGAFLFVARCIILLQINSLTIFFTKHAPKNLTGCTGAPEIQRFVFKPFLSCMYFKLKTPRSTGLSISWQTFTWCVMKAKLKWFIFCTWYSPTVNQAHQCDQFDSWERSCVAAGEPVQLPAERLITFLGRHKTRQR